MAQIEYSEFTKKILWWLNLRWVGLAMIGAFFAKLFYGSAPAFYHYLMVGLLVAYGFSFLLWAGIKIGGFRHLVIQIFASIIFVFDLLLIFWLSGRIFPLADLHKFIPLSFLLNTVAFLYFLVIISAAVVLGMTESIVLALLASILFLFQRNILVAPSWFVGEVSWFGVETMFLFFLGIFLVGFLAVQLENKKRELDETNAELTQKIKDLEGRRRELIQLEKKASLHQLAVSLNHEINNPLTSILGNAQFFFEQFEKNPFSVPETFGESVYDSLIEAKKIKELLRKIRRISEPIVSEYIPGIKMIDIDRASG